MPLGRDSRSRPLVFSLVGRCQGRWGSAKETRRCCSVAWTAAVCASEAFEDHSPLIYFYALVPGIYQILYPCYLMEWNPRHHFCTVAIGSQFELTQPSVVRKIAGQYESVQPPAASEPTPPIERRYSTIEAKVRLHQAEFRELVLSAYDRRCSVSGLPIPELLQAAHIIPDRDERGQPNITNGICLSILHHTA
jgi:putative restriction endonuclease